VGVVVVVVVDVVVALVPAQWETKGQSNLTKAASNVFPFPRAVGIGTPPFITMTLGHPNVFIPTGPRSIQPFFHAKAD